jgi:hypothetical protein
VGAKDQNKVAIKEKTRIKDNFFMGICLLVNDLVCVN